MLKEITPVNQVFTNVAVSSTNSYTSLISQITYKDTICYQLQWSGAPVGSFKIQGSLDYNPGLPQSGGAANAGTWADLAITNPLTGVTASSFSTTLGSPILINLNQLGFPYIKVVYTNASSTGTLNGYLSAKSLG